MVKNTCFIQHSNNLIVKLKSSVSNNTMNVLVSEVEKSSVNKQPDTTAASHHNFPPPLPSSSLVSCSQSTTIITSFLSVFLGNPSIHFGKPTSHNFISFFMFILFLGRYEMFLLDTNFDRFGRMPLAMNSLD